MLLGYRNNKGLLNYAEFKILKLNKQPNVCSMNKISEALKYFMWLLISILVLSDLKGNGCMKLSIRKDFNFQPVGDNVTH